MLAVSSTCRICITCNHRVQRSIGAPCNQNPKHNFLFFFISLRSLSLSRHLRLFFHHHIIPLYLPSSVLFTLNTSFTTVLPSLNSFYTFKYSFPILFICSPCQHSSRRTVKPAEATSHSPYVLATAHYFPSNMRRTAHTRFSHIPIKAFGFSPGSGRVNNCRSSPARSLLTQNAAGLMNIL